MKNLSRNPRTEFSESFVQNIETQIDQALSEGAAPIAAFDADGTLWDMDLGELFFDYQIRHCNLPHLRGISDPWQHYFDLKKIEYRKGYTWLAQINEGQSEKQVHEWARACVESLQPLPYVASMLRLIQFLQSRGVEIFVVTASIKYAVEPGAKAAYKIPYTHTLGVETKVEARADGERMITDIVCHPITWHEGKAEALLKATGGRKPLLCAGNTDGDISLIEAASHVHLAVATQDIDNSLRNAEQLLQAEALRRGWTTHLFRGGARS